VGGNWPGWPDGSAEFPQEMLVDWVRVYEIPEPSTLLLWLLGLSAIGITRRRNRA
jgi:hypothetical protein